MASTYFDYVLSQCKTQGIGSICSVANTRRNLIKLADSIFDDCKDITADWRLFEVVKICLDNKRIIDSDTLNRDAMDIYNRCKTIAYSCESINYDKAFDFLVDFNWLQASIQNAKDNSSRYVSLMSDPIKMRNSLKKYLDDVFDISIQNYYDSIYIDEAIKARRKIFTGLYPFKYKESRQYLSTNDYSDSELESMNEAKNKDSHKGMALFFGLTATEALAENIRKGFC